MSPWKKSCATPCRFARLPAYVSLSRTTTSSPASASRRAKCEPMKPAPPVIRTLTQLNYLLGARLQPGSLYLTLSRHEREAFAQPVAPRREPGRALLRPQDGVARALDRS